MAEEETRRALKIFGVKVTDFEDKSQEIVEKAAEAARRGDRESLLPLLEDVIGLASDLNRWWLEITQRVFEQRHRTYAELLRIIGEVKEPPKQEK